MPAEFRDPEIPPNPPPLPPERGSNRFKMGGIYFTHALFIGIALIGGTLVAQEGTRLLLETTSLSTNVINVLSSDAGALGYAVGFLGSIADWRRLLSGS